MGGRKWELTDYSPFSFSALRLVLFGVASFPWPSTPFAFSFSRASTLRRIFTVMIFRRSSTWEMETVVAPEDFSSARSDITSAMHASIFDRMLGGGIAFKKFNCFRIRGEELGY